MAPKTRFTSPVRVLLIESSPRFTNRVQSAFYYSSPVRVLLIESSPRFTNPVQSAFCESSPRFASPVQSAFYHMPSISIITFNKGSHSHYCSVFIIKCTIHFDTAIYLTIVRQKKVSCSNLCVTVKFPSFNRCTKFSYLVCNQL